MEKPPVLGEAEAQSIETIASMRMCQSNGQLDCTMQFVHYKCEPGLAVLHRCPPLKGHEPGDGKYFVLFFLQKVLTNFWERIFFEFFKNHTLTQIRQNLLSESAKS